MARDSVPSDSAATAPAHLLEDPLIRVILQRRSHRVGFDDRPVPDSVLAEIARCGLAAPSSKNAQPWRLHVVTDGGLIREIADGVGSAPGIETYVPADPATGLPRLDWESTVLESAEVLRGSPAAFFVENLGRFSEGRSKLADAPTEALPGVLIAYMLECVGIGAAVQNLWLAAQALGLRACFLGDVGVDHERIEARLGMEGDLVGVLVVGYSALDPEAKRPVDYETDRVRWHRCPPLPD